MKTAIYNEPELAILEGIGEAEREGHRITQRDLAGKAGLSLGMTNALLRQFAELGWVKLTKLSTRSVVYALTPEGMAEIARRTAGFFQRASRNSERYRARLEAFVVDAKNAGASTLVLAGASDLDFLLEYLCEMHGLVYVKSADLERARALGKRPGVALLLAEGEADSPWPTVQSLLSGSRREPLVFSTPNPEGLGDNSFRGSSS